MWESCSPTKIAYLWHPWSFFVFLTFPSSLYKPQPYGMISGSIQCFTWLLQVSPTTGGRASLTWPLALRWVRLGGDKEGLVWISWVECYQVVTCLMSYVSWGQRRSTLQSTNWNVLGRFLRGYPTSWGLSRVQCYISYDRDHPGGRLTHLMGVE